MRQEHRNQQGFTLVEIQIALLILLLIMAVLMGSLHLVSKTSNAAERLSENSSELRIVSRFLKQQLENIMPLKALENGKTALLFKGESSGVYYIGHLPEHVVKGGPWLLHLYQGEQQLLLDYRVFDNTRSVRENLTGDFETVVLLNDVESTGFSYFDDETGSWKTRWDEPETLPSGIKVVIEQSQRVWPLLTTMLKNRDATQSRLNVLKIN